MIGEISDIYAKRNPLKLPVNPRLIIAREIRGSLTEEDLAWALRKCDRLKSAAAQAGVPWTILAAACLAGKNNLFGVNDQ